MVIQPPQTQLQGQRPLNATPPIFEKPPTVGRFIEGGDAHFECRVRGNPQPEVVWSRRGMPIKNDNRRNVSYNPTTGMCVFDIKSLTAEDDGEYTCTAVNCAGEASLTVNIQRDVRGQVVSQDTFRQVHMPMSNVQSTYIDQQRQYTQSYVQQQSIDGMYQRTTSAEYEMDSSPMYYSGTESFRVDTFEYRLLREVEFRESLFRRLPGEEAPEKPVPLDKAQPPSAPQILARPRNSKLLEGSEATFQAKISGNPKPKITWFKNGQRIISSQRFKMSYANDLAALHIHMALPEDAGYYTLLAENTNGRIACSAHLVIEGVGAPVSTTFQQQLQHQKTDGTAATAVRTTQENDVDVSGTGASRALKPNFVKIPGDKEVTEGKMVRFDLRVSGRPFPDVTWYLNGNQVVDDATHKLLVNEGGVHALMITSASRTDAGNYTCIAKNKSGEVSFNVNLHVIEKEQIVAPKFVERFQSLNVREGESATLHCRAIGTPIPNITWQKDGVQIHSSPPNILIETLDGASAIYFNQVTMLDSAWYQCTAQNQAGSTAIRGRLYVASETAPMPEPWRLNLPRPQKVIAPEGSPPREVVWLKPVERAAPRARAPEEERPPQKPAFTTHIRDLNLQEGDRAHFDARLVPIGDPTMVIEWYVNGKLIEASSRVMTTYNFGYVALTLLHVYSEDSGVYMCRAVNEAGEATTTATLRCVPRAQIERTPQHPESIEAIRHLEDHERYQRQESIEETVSQVPVFVRPLHHLENISEGGFAHFEGQITPVSDPAMKIEWLFNGQPLTAGTRISTTYSFGYVALNISYVRAEDSGVYMCKATNKKGEAISTATLKVRVSEQVTASSGIAEQQSYIQKTQELEAYQMQQRQTYVEVDQTIKQKPYFKTQLIEKLELNEGKTAHFEARLEPSGDSTMRVEWLKDGKSVEASSRISTFFNFGYVSITIRGVDARDTGTYTCVATNSMGTASSSTKFICISKKSVVVETQHPEGLQKIQHLEDSSRYQRDVQEDVSFTQKPTFKTELIGKSQLIEGQSAHFETRLEPMGDPSMTVEWYFNGLPLTTGHRFKTYFDFGYVALDILYVFPEDTGTFTVVAKNSMGQATLQRQIHVQAKSSVDTSTIHEIEEKIEYLERPQHDDTGRFIEEISKTKPHFPIPLHSPKPLKEGERVHLECRVEPVGDPTLTIEWFFNGKQLPSGSRFQVKHDFGHIVLDITTAYPEDTGEYTVRATNHLGSAHTSACITVIGKSGVVSETQHPEGLQKIQHLEDSSRYKREQFEDTIITQMPTFTKPLHNIETVEGTNIHLECRLAPVGDPSMKIEWFVNGVSLKVGHRFRPAFEFDYVALDILSVYAEDSGVYTCKATSSLGQAVTSCSVKCTARSQIILESQHPEGLQQIQYLEDQSRHKRETWEEETVKIQPKFLSKLHNLTLHEGQMAHFECRLEPINDSSLRVEWFRNGKSLPVGHRYRPFHDFGYVALNIISVVPEDSGCYTCRAVNTIGTAEIQATLNVSGKSAIQAETQHPEGLQKIQMLEDYSRYQRDIYQEELTTQTPVFTKAPQNAEIQEGHRVHFECRLIPVGDPKLKVEWFHNGRPVKQGTRFVQTFSFGFVALDIMYAYPEDSGTYTCKAVNSLGEAVTSATLKCHSKSSLILESQQPESLQKIQQLEDMSRYQRRDYIEESTTQAPVFTQAMRNLQLMENQSAHFECRLIPVGDTKLKVEWFHNGIAIMPASRVTLTHDFGFVALDLAYVKPEDSGTYTCKATNELGQAVCSATLAVRGSSSLVLETPTPRRTSKNSVLRRYQSPPAPSLRGSPYFLQLQSFVTPLTGPSKLVEGHSSHLECRIEPYPDPTMKIEWFFNGKPLPTGSRYRTMFDFGFAALDILTVYAEDSGEYTIRATNSLGTSSSSARINVAAKKSLILESQQPDSLQKIRMLEDHSRFARPEEPEQMFDKPNFGRPLYNLDNLLEGQSAHLEATLTPVNDPTMRVEWYHNGVPIKPAHRFRTVCDFGYVALDILYVFAEDSGTYMCKATNRVGEAITTCSIKVQAKESIYTDTLHEEGLQKIRALEDHYRPAPEEPVIPITRPVFITPLKNVENIKEGQPVHLECKLEPVNDPKLKVEWYVNGVEIKAGHRFRTVHDFGYVALDILYSYGEDTGTYMCKAVNELGEAVTTCTVKVEARRNIYYDTQHPEGLEKIRELECQTKYRPIEVEEKPICKPYFVSELRGITEYKEGDSAHFEARVEPSHDPDLKIEFFHNGKPLEAATRFHVTIDFGYIALDMSHVYPEDEGQYTVRASNSLGEATSTINIRVHSKSGVISDTQHPEGLAKIQALEDESRRQPMEYVEKRTFQRPVFTAPLQNLDLEEGQSAHMECRLIPVGDPTLTVEWYFNEAPLQPSSRFQTTHDFGYVALDIQYVRPDDVGVYTCRARNELGEAVTTAKIRVQTKAFIELQSHHPEGYERIQELENYKQAPSTDMPEKAFEKPVFTVALFGPSELMEGMPAHLECRVVPIGDPDLKIQWFVNGVALKQAARFREIHDFGMVSLDIASTIAEDSGVYMCKAVNKAGEAVTTTSMVVRSLGASVIGESQHPEAYLKTQKFEMGPVRPAEPEAPAPRAPFFTEHLVNQDTLVEGQYIHLEARVEPATDEKLRIEWYKNGKQLVCGTRIRTMCDFGLVSLDIVTVRPDDSGIYTCRAVNEVGEAITTCTMKVEDRESIIYRSQHPESLPRIQELESWQAVSPETREPAYEQPIFISHLNNLELKEGQPAHFECRIEPYRDPKLKIEFQLNGKPLPSATRFNVSKDFGYITLDISHTLAEDAGIYTCKATNEKGQALTTGSLKIIDDKEFVIERTTHPMGQEGLSKVREVEEMYLSKYQTHIDDTELQYPKPVFVVPLLEKYAVNESEGLRLECRVEPAADPKLTIEWFFNGKPLNIGTRFQLTNDFGQVVLASTDMWGRDSGVYTCRAYNAMGEAFTSTTIHCAAKGSIYEGTLHPEGEKGLESIQTLEESLLRSTDQAITEDQGHPPIFTSHFQNLTNLTEGDIAHFEATLAPAGDQTMVVEWFFKNQPLKAGHRIRTVHAFGMVVLEILGVVMEDSGEYTCKATNKWGKAEITVKLECVDRTRGQKPKFTSQLKSLTGLKEGDSAHFECHLIPIGDPAMRVEWFHNGVPMRHSSRIKTLSDFGYVVMDISFVHVEDSGEYVCVATNKYGSDTTRCTIECTGHGKIFRDTLQPQSLEKIAELEGSHSLYKSQISIDAKVTEAPKFTTHIKEVSNLVEGQSAHFEAYLTPTNDPNIKVEWYFNGKLLGAGHRFRTFHDFGIVILDILYCYGEDTGEYMCKATNKFGSDITKTTLKCRSKSSIILEPQLPKEMADGNRRIMELEEHLYRSRGEYQEEIHLEAPRFTVPLENVTDLREGENAHLEARLTPTDDPDLKVEWFKNSKTLKAGTRIRTINDFGFVVLEISPIYPEDSGLYSCRATNKVGEAVTTCTLKCSGKRSIILDTQLPEGMESIQKIARFEDISSARISEQWMDVEVQQPPKFITKPQDQTLPENSLAHFECRLTPVNDPTMRVEWYFNGKTLITGSRVKTINDFGFVILEIAGVFGRDAGIYTCKAINAFGEATVTAKLTVKAKSSVIMEPQLPSEWQSGTQSLQRLEEAMYRTEEVIIDDDRKMPPKFITQIQNLENKEEGEAAHFECRLEPVGDPTMRVEWFVNGKPLIKGTRVHTVDDFGFVVLDIDWLFPRDAGEYMCRAINKWGQDTTKAVLKIKSKRNIIMDSQLPEGMSAEKLRELDFPPQQEQPIEEVKAQPPKFITQIQPQENLQEGDSAHFECRLEPINDPKLRVEWYHNGVPLKSGHRFKTTHDFGFVALDVLYVYAEDSGEYTARAVNDYGEDITKTTLKVKATRLLEYRTQLPKSMEQGVQKIAEMEASWQRVVSEEEVPVQRCRPTFVMKPEPQVVTEGEWAKFCCRVIGNPRPRIMWIVNGHTIGPGSRYKLTYDGIYHLDIPKTRQYDQGKVEVFARNGLGEAYCCTTLQVRPRHDDYRVVLKNSPRQYTPRKPSWALDLETEKKEEKPHSPKIETPLRDVFIKTPGRKVSLECIIKGVPRPTVTWYHNEKVIDVKSGYYVVSYKDNKTILVILKVTKEVEGKYTCKAVNEHGEEVTTAYLYVGVTRDEHEAQQKVKPVEAKPKKPVVKKATEETTYLQRTREFKEVKSATEKAETALGTQTHIQVQQILPQEQPSEVVPTPLPVQERAEVELVVSSQHTLSVSEVHPEEKAKEFKPHELPGSKTLDVTIPSDVVAEVSEVVTQDSLKELKSGELPGTERAEVSIPFELAMQVLEVLEHSSFSDLKPDETPGSKMADVSIPSELAAQVFEVLATSSIGDLQVSERPGSRQADMEISPDIAAEVSMVTPHSTVQDLKPGEVPGSREAEFSVPSEVAMQISEVTTQGSLFEMAEDIPSSATAQVSIPSELATQILEILSSSSVTSLTAETLPGARKVEVILPSEVAMQVYETLVHSSIVDMKPMEKPSSVTALLGMVEKVPLQVSQITPDLGLEDMTIQRPVEVKAKESARPELPTAQTEAVQVLEEASEPIKPADVKSERKPSLKEEKPQDITDKVVLKRKKKPKEEFPTETVLEQKPVEEEKPKEISEQSIVKIKKKPKEEEKPVEVILDTKPETKPEDTIEESVLKIKKKVKIEKPEDVVIKEIQPKQEEYKTEEVVEHAALKIKKKPKEDQTPIQHEVEEAKIVEKPEEITVTPEKRSTEPEQETVVKLKRKSSLKEVPETKEEIKIPGKLAEEAKPKEISLKPKRKTSIKMADQQDVVRIEKENVPEFKVLQPTPSKADESTVKAPPLHVFEKEYDLDVLKGQEEKVVDVPVEEKTAKVTLKKKPKIKEETPVAKEEFNIALRQEEEEEVFEDAEEYFSLSVPQKPKDIIVEDEIVEITISEPAQSKYTVEEQTVDLTIKKKIFIEEPKPQQAEISKELEFEEKVKIKRKPKKMEEPQAEEVTLPKQPKQETDKEVTEEFQLDMPSKQIREDIIEEVSLQLKELKTEEVKQEIKEEKVELTVEKVEETASEVIKEEVKEEKPEIYELTEEKVKFKRPKKPKKADEPHVEEVKIPLKSEQEIEEVVDVQDTFKIETIKKPESKDVVEETTLKLSVAKIEKDVSEVEEVKTTVKKKKKKPQIPLEEPSEVTEFKVKQDKPEEIEPEFTEDVQESFAVKLKPKEKRDVTEEKAEEIVVLTEEEPKPLTVTEEAAEITVKKVEENEEKPESIVLKKKKTPKAKDDSETEIKLELQKRPEKKEEPEKHDESVSVVSLKTKPKSKVEDVQEEIKLQPQPEEKPYPIIEETAEITVKKENIQEEVSDVKIIQKKKKQKPKEEEIPVEVKFKLDEEKVHLPEEKPEDVEETFAVKMPKKKDVEEVVESVTDIITIPAPEVQKREETVESELTVKKLITEEKPTELHAEEVPDTEVTKKLKLKKKLELKPEEKPVEETFAIPLKKETLIEEVEKVPTEEVFSVKLTEKRKEKEEKSVEESFKLVVEAEKPKKVEEVEAAETTVLIKPKDVPEEIVVKKEPEKKEEVEVTKKLKLKKKPEMKPEEKPVEETFAIPLKKEKHVEPEEKAPVEEVFSVKLTEKRKEKEEKSIEESFKLVVEAEKPKKVEEVETAETTVLIKPKDVPEEIVVKKEPEKKEEVEVTKKLKLKKKPEVKSEEKPVEETFAIPLKKEKAVEPKEEAPVEEVFSVKLTEKRKEKEEKSVEESFKLVVEAEKPKKVEEVEAAETTVLIKPKDVSEEIIVKKEPEKKEEEEEVTKKLKLKKKPEVKPEEKPVEETFAIPLKKEKTVEPEEAPVEEVFSVKLTEKRKEKEEKSVEESFKLVVEAEKPKKVEEVEAAETTVLIKPKDVPEEIIVKKELEKKEEVEVTKKLKLKKKPELKPEEKPVEETFAIPLKKEKPKEPEETHKEEPVEEQFAVVVPKKVKPKVEDAEETKIILPEKPKEYKVTEENEEVTVKKFVEEEEKSVVLKKRKVETRKESVSEEFKIKRKEEKTEEVDASEFTVQKKKKEETKSKPTVGEDSLKLTLTEEKKPEITEESAEITVRKKPDTSETTEERRISIKKPKKKQEPDEKVEESFTVSRKKSVEESSKDVEETFQLKTVTKKKPQIVSDEEESLSLSLAPDKPEYKTEEISDETKVILQKPEEKEEEILEILESIEYVAIKSFVSDKSDSVSLVEGERVQVIERTSQDWWFVRKVITNEKGFVPPTVLQDSATYTHYMKETLSKKIEKLPVLRKPKPGEKLVAPKFVKKLTPLQVLDGQTAEISCQVSGNPRPTITWFKQTQIIKPSEEFQIFYDEDNVTTLVIREVFPEDAGTYTVVAKNAAGFASCSAELVVETDRSETFPSSRLSLSRQSSLTDILEGIPPVFTEKPKDKSVDEGKPVELSCKVTGVPEPKITWLRNQKPLKESDRIEMTVICEDLDITKMTVTIKSAKPEDAGTYQIIAENREGKSVTSLILNVTEKPKKPKDEPPTFVQTFSDVICSEKDTLTLTAKVQGTPTPEIVWYKNGKILKPSKVIQQTVNKELCTLVIPDIKETDTGDYKCVAKNPKGTVEHSAKVTVQKTGVDFTQKLYDVEVKEREPVVFSIEVSHPSAKVTWHKDGEQIKPDDRIKFVEDGCTRKLLIQESNINDEGEYTCVLGEKECTADLVVVELPPDFKGEMKDVTVAKEQSASFQVELTKGDARARWYKNDKEIEFSEHVMLKIEGKRQKLIIYNASFEDAGSYTCVVGNKKRTAKLSVEAPTVEFTAKLPEKMTVPQDTDVSFTVELSRPDVPVKWLKDGEPVPEKEKEKFQFVKDRNVYKMLVRRAQKDDAAEYSCVAGNVKTTTKLQVQEAHAEFTLKLRDVVVRESDTATLLVEVTRETFEVRWMKDGQTLKPTDRVIMEKEGCRRRLIIKDTHLEDRGMYSCVLEEKMSSSTLTVEATPRVVSEKRHFKGKRGGNVIVDVEFLALPQPKIEWSYKGKPITSDKKRSVENYGNKTVVTIKKVDDADVGNYTLKLTNKCGECKTDFEVSIIDKPKPPSMPSASEIGDTSLTLSWKAPESDGGSPITNYIIEFHDRSTLRWSTYNENFVIDQPFTKVENLKEGDEYMFRVIAVNEVGKSDPSPGTKYILVREPKAGEPPAVIEHLQPVACGLRKPAKMSCRISGQPAPTIKWLKNGKDLVILKNLTATYENQLATLQIAETTEKSAGTYTCKATNHLGTAETSTELKIQEPPSVQFDDSLKNVRLKSFSEYVLEVKVFGYPSPELVWLKNGKVLESTKHTLVQIRENSTTITIRSVENTDSGTYTLQLSNPAGTFKQDFKLFVLDKPLPPEGPITFHKIDKTSVTIGWQSPSIGESEVLKYVIEKCEYRRKVWLEVTTVSSDILTQEIKDLSEGIEYAFRVIATNDYGRSDPLTSDPVTPKSLFDKPHAPKGPFTTSNMTESSFTLSWLAPDNDGGSTILEYIVERKEASRKAWQRVGTTDGKSLSMEVIGLKQDTAYHFRVCCRNDVGHSSYFSPEETITPGLRISPPSPPVGPLTVVNMTNKTLTLSWKPPATTGGADLTAYIIEKRESTKKSWNRLETLEPNVTTYTVHNLTNTKEYFFRVFAENPAGLSPPLESDKAIKLTSTAVRPSPPTGPLEVVVTGPSSVLIAWGRPESDGGSPITGYTVALKNVRRIMWMEVGQVNGETQRMQIKDLQEDAAYMVRIIAKNEVGISDPLEPEEPIKVIRPPGFKESEAPELDEKTISVSYSTETSSSWIREANVEPMLHTYTKHVLAGRNEYFFRIWTLAESLYK
ncbi:titin-like isoform X2 [Uloborus diversus]|uniref:titin-like isoform X2 n=1 Tax=Uloborus diversus TaxID=327109 RepID=UPI0024094CB2|nr:titin-like isoform X2 [Uloborus diversus]